MDRILRAEIYVNESDGQLRAAHLILDYNPILRAFQAPLCVIRAKDPWLHRINVAYKGFVVPQGIPLPRYSRSQNHFPLPALQQQQQCLPPPPLPPIFQVEEEEEVEREEEGFVDLTLLTDDYEVLINPLHHQTYLKTWVFKGNPNTAFKNY